MSTRCPWEPRTFYNTACFGPLAIGAGLLSMGGTVLSGLGNLAGGRDALAAAKTQARQLNDQANTTKAVSQRQAIDETRQADLAVSRSRALAAASGGGAADPSVITGQAEIARQGEYNSLVRLYTGDSAAQQLRYQAKMTRYGGQQARTASYGGLFQTVLSGISSPTGGPDLSTFAMKYGAGPTGRYG